uniref:Uncharacterized protein n=1 Tax=Amphimedon queenslandica TaxID=400682 RepID=A0A1X7UCP6_AMPQE
MRRLFEGGGNFFDYHGPRRRLFEGGGYSGAAFTRGNTETICVRIPSMAEVEIAFLAQPCCVLPDTMCAAKVARMLFVVSFQQKMIILKSFPSTSLAKELQMSFVDRVTVDNVGDIEDKM